MRHIFFGAPSAAATVYEAEAEIGSYAITGSPAALNKTLVSTAEAGSYVIAGQPVHFFNQELAYSDDPTPTNWGGWFDVPNAFDGSLATYAYTTSGPGSLFVNNVEGQEHSITTDFRSIINIYARVYQQVTDCEGTHEFEAGEFGWYLPPTSVNGWTDETHVPEVLAGWNIQTHQLWDNHHTKSSGTLEMRVYKTEYRVEFHKGLRGFLYNFDLTGFTDAQGAWTSETNINVNPVAFGNLLANKNGSNSNNALVLTGTNAPGSGGPIRHVYLRFSGRDVDYAAIHCEIWTAGKVELLRTESVADTGSAANFGPWVRINPPAAGWTWDVLQNLEAYLYGTGWASGSSPAQVNYVQIKAFVHELFTNAGEYTITGSPAGLKRTLMLPANTGSYVLSGSDALLEAAATGYETQAEAGVYTITGSAAALNKTLVSEAAVGSYTLTGLAAALRRDLVLGAGSEVTGAAGYFTSALTIDGAWAFPTRASDSSLATYASTASASGITYLRLDGAESFLGVGQKIRRVQFRIYGSVTGTGTPRFNIRLYHVPTAQFWPAFDIVQTTNQWSAWFDIPPPGTGWPPSGIDPGVIYALIRVYDDSGTLTEARVYEAQIQAYASTAHYNIIGATAALKKAVALSAAPGSYVITGADADFLALGQVPAESGSYTITGVDADLLITLLHEAEAGAYTLTGADADFSVVFTADAQAGSYTITGSSASLLRSYYLGAQAGAYALTGVDADLVPEGQLEAGAGSYTLVGADAGLLRQLQLDAEAGSYTITGASTGFDLGFQFDSESGSYTITGSPAALQWALALAAETGNYVISGAAAELLFLSGELQATEGAYTLTGADAALNYSSGARRVIIVS